MNRFWCSLFLLGMLVAPTAHAIVPGGVQSVELTVDGVQRHALIYVPKTEPGKTVPLVFVFHGHGSDAAKAVGEFGINRYWTEAISVYPQGLNIPSITDPEGARAGWQHTESEVGDRDLHFFDALLVRLKSAYPVDAKRVYTTGHSNGGGFTYLLWLARPNVFAAVAPCSAAPKFTAQLTPKSAFIGAGRQDPIVAFAHQEEEAATVRKVNGCAETGEHWGGGVGIEYSSKGGTPLVTYFYDGGHGMTPEEPSLIVQFFQQHPAP